MRKIVSGILCGTLIALPAFAKDPALDSFYVSGGGGVAWTSTDDWSRHPFVPGGTFPINQPSSAHETVGMFGVALGYAFSFPVRIEANYKWYSETKYVWNQVFATSIDDQFDAEAKLQPQVILANVYYDFHNRTRLVPFVGGGIGYQRTKVDLTISHPGGTDPVSSRTEDGFAWTVIAGVKYRITPKLSADIRADYTDFGSMVACESNCNYDFAKTDSFSATTASANLTYSF